MDRYIRLDTLEPCWPTRLWWGVNGGIVKVRRFALHPDPARGRVPFLAVSTQWAVRLVPDRPLDRKAARLAYLIDRDHGRCLYCDHVVDPMSCTVEHIVPKSAGGPDHASNLALACGSCNAAAGHLSAVEKVRLARRYGVAA